MPTDFLVITTLAHEREACLERLQDQREFVAAGYSVRAGTVGNCAATVVLADRMGSANASTVTTALIDEAVAAAYGWSPELSDDEILAKLLDLNLQSEPVT